MLVSYNTSQHNLANLAQDNAALSQRRTKFCFFKAAVPVTRSQVYQAVIKYWQQFSPAKHLSQLTVQDLGLPTLNKRSQRYCHEMVYALLFNQVDYLAADYRTASLQQMLTRLHRLPPHQKRTKYSPLSRNERQGIRRFMRLCQQLGSQPQPLKLWEQAAAMLPDFYASSKPALASYCWQILAEIASQLNSAGAIGCPPLLENLLQSADPWVIASWREALVKKVVVTASQPLAKAGRVINPELAWNLLMNSGAFTRGERNSRCGQLLLNCAAAHSYADWLFIDNQIKKPAEWLDVSLIEKLLLTLINVAQASSPTYPLAKICYAQQLMLRYGQFLTIDGRLAILEKFYGLIQGATHQGGYLKPSLTLDLFEAFLDDFRQKLPRCYLRSLEMMLIASNYAPSIYQRLLSRHADYLTDKVLKSAYNHTNSGQLIWALEHYAMTSIGAQRNLTWHKRSPARWQIPAATFSFVCFQFDAGLDFSSKKVEEWLQLLTIHLIDASIAVIQPFTFSDLLARIDRYLVRHEAIRARQAFNCLIELPAVVRRLRIELPLLAAWLNHPDIGWPPEYSLPEQRWRHWLQVSLVDDGLVYSGRWELNQLKSIYEGFYAALTSLHPLFKISFLSADLQTSFLQRQSTWLCQQYTRVLQQLSTQAIRPDDERLTWLIKSCYLSILDQEWDEQIKQQLQPFTYLKHSFPTTWSLVTSLLHEESSENLRVVTIHYQAELENLDIFDIRPGVRIIEGFRRSL